jgi:feruloyl-CoA synthase
VTPGYWWRPDLTAEAFDGDGFYRMGDIVRPIDVRAPQRGLEFVSRADARFKLSSGTWVRAGALRDRFLSECSDVADAVVTGESRGEIGLLVWPTAEGALLNPDVLRAQVIAAMHRSVLEVSGHGPRRALVLKRPPAPHERAGMIARVHASEPDAEVIVL